MQTYGNIAPRVLLATFLMGSVGLFCYRLWGVLRIVQRAKPTQDWQWHSIAQRLWRFTSEVLLQTKVIRQRPAAGIAHALVFWTFCVFSLVTANHILEGFGGELLPHDSRWALAFTLGASAFALACAISIAGLAYRRLVIRPRWLGPVSRESAVIAGLIFLLMVTYLPAWWLPVDSPAKPLLWWVHTLTLLIFLPLVPHTKHLHLVLSPFTIFLKRAQFSAVPPLAGDEDFGLVAGRDVDQVSALQALSCVECGRCTEHCPANNTGKELDPKQIVLGLRTYLRTEGPGSEQPILGSTISEQAVFQCTTCGACEYQCPVGIQHLPVILGLRRGAVNTGAWEDEHGGKLFENLERYGNALGLPAADRDRFVTRAQFPIFDGSQEFCLWLGCTGAYDPRGREIVTAFAAVMRHLGTSFGVLRKERCTGDPIRRLGNDLLFDQLSQDNQESLTTNRVKKLVSICPHCVRTIAEDWRSSGLAVTVEHHSEFLARYRSQLPSANGEPGFVYHDPCYLGRYRNVYDEPRAVIGTDSQAIDPPRARERGFCCGAGGGLTFLGEETGTRVSHNRASELAATCEREKTSTVATACPFCSSMLRDGLTAVAGEKIALVDIAEIVAARLN